MDPLVLAGLPLLPVALVLWMRRRHPGMPRGWWVSQSEAAILHRRLHRGVDETRRAVARAGAGVSIDLARREAYGIGRPPIHELRDGDT